MSEPAPSRSDRGTIRARLRSGVTANLLLRPLLLVLSLGQSVLLARWLGPELLAVVAGVAALSGTLTVVFDFGITRSLPKILTDLGVHAGRRRVLRAERGLLRFKLGLVALSMLGLVGYELAGASRRDLLGLAPVLFFGLVAARAIVDSVLSFRRSAASAAFHHAVLLRVRTTFRAFAPIATLLVAWLTRRPELVVAVAVVAAGLEALVVGRVARYDLDEARDDGGAAAPSARQLVRRYGAYVGVTYLIFSFNRLVFGLPFTLGVLAALGADAATLGAASIAVSLVRQVLDLAILPLAGLRAPLIARLTAEGDALRLQRAQMVLTAVLVLGTGCLAVALVTVGWPALEWLYGAPYREAVRWGVLGALAVLFASVFTLGNTALHQAERFFPEILGLLAAFAVIAIGLPAVVLHTPASAWPLATILSFVAARASFWIITDLWADASVFRFVSTAMKGRGLLAMGTAVSAATLFERASIAGCLGAGVSALCIFLGLFRLLGGVGPLCRDFLAELLPPRLRWMARLG